MIAFIEVNKFESGAIVNMAPMAAYLLKWSGEINRKHGIETIAIFKIYPKVKPVIAHYDYDLKTTILE